MRNSVLCVMIMAEEPESEARGEQPVIRRFTRPAAPIPWPQRVLPLAGLALFVGSVWGLIGEGALPGWQPGWTHGGKTVVILDPGHGGGDTGAVAQGVVEKDLNLDVGLRVADVLRSRGVAVRMTRESDHFVELEDRVRMANAVPDAVFVSIHFNDASGDGKAAMNRASGIETYYCERKLLPVSNGGDWIKAALFGKGAEDGGAWAVREGQTLADCIQGSLIAGTAATDRGIKERSLYVTHRVLAPSVLVEGGFVSHPGEARRLGSAAYRQTLADFIAGGILKYLDTARRAPGQSAPVRA